MSYGSSQWCPIVKDEEESIEMIKKAYEAGVNFFETADFYSNGLNGVLLGKALKHIGAPRGRIFIATKFNFPVYDNVSQHGLFGLDKKPALVNLYGSSRKHIFDAVDASLKRLDVEYIDLW
jgi:aryl-alcohol dehydrogenase-like predicted oxidoreductase